MNPVMTPRQGRKGGASQMTAKAQTCRKTTLYDKIAALRSDVEPAEEHLGVTIVVRCPRTEHLTLAGNVPAAG
jgi:hypothetical protein